MDKKIISQIWSIILIIFMTSSILLIAIFHLPGLEEIKYEVFEEETYGYVVELSPDGNSVAVGTQWTGQVRIYDFESGKQKHILPINMRGYQNVFVKWSPDGGKIATLNSIDQMPTLNIWDNEGELLKKFITPDGSFWRSGNIVWSPNGDEVALGSRNTLTIINIENGNEREYTYLPPSVNNDINSIDWSSDGAYIALGRMKYLHIVDVLDGTEITNLSENVRSVAWKPNSHIIAFRTLITPYDYYIKIWDFTSEPEPTIIYHSEGFDTLNPKTIMWSPDAREMVVSVSFRDLSGKFKQGFTLIDADDFAVKYTSFAPPQNEIQSRHAIPLPIDVSDDGKWIITGSKDGGVLVWDYETGDYVKTIPGYSYYQLFFIGMIIFILILQVLCLLMKKFNGTLSMLFGSTIVLISILVDASDSVIRAIFLWSAIGTGLILYLIGFIALVKNKQYYFIESHKQSKFKILDSYVFPIFLILMALYSIYTFLQIMPMLSSMNDYPAWYPIFDYTLAYLVLLGMIIPVLIHVLYGSKLEVSDFLQKKIFGLTSFSVIMGNLIFLFFFIVIVSFSVSEYFFILFFVSFSIIPVSAGLSLSTIKKQKDADSSKRIQTIIARSYLRVLQIVSVAVGVVMVIVTLIMMSYGT